MKRKSTIFVIPAVILAFLVPLAHAGNDAFTQKDRELLIRLDERLDQIDKRFEQIDKRFEQIDKRFEELRQDMNKRFEQVDKRFEELRQDMNKRFEQIDKRFEQADKRFESLQTMMMAMVGAFAAIVAVTIGFAIWDRRTMAKPFEYKIQENSRKIDEIVNVLKELGRHDERIATVLRSISLL